MNEEEFRKAIAASPMECARCKLIECTCWRLLDKHIVFPPTGKAFIVAMKVQYRKVFENIKIPEVF